MKKSILALGATVALGGLGFAGSAHAIAVFGDGGATNTGALRLNPGSVGHMLFTPYYTAQGTSSTMFNITNTDTQNGKVVKVRFRGASNSDDVLDFTVFLSPGDVWSAGLAPDAGGFGRLSTSDSSCTIPFNADWPANGAPLSDLRLDPKLTAEQKAVNANEGYIEVLNMADIPRNNAKDSLYTNIKHVAGKAPCDPAGFEGMLAEIELPAGDDDVLDVYGLAQPTGGLMGTWAVFNQAELAVFSGNMGAVVASRVNGDGTLLVGPDLVTPVSGTANFAVSPQVEAVYGGTTPVNNLTSDPLLTGLAPRINALWYDLPDMSTPSYADPVTDPLAAREQAADLSNALGRNRIFNDYIADASGSVPMATDWIISQPTRRYHAAVAYHASSAAQDTIVLTNFGEGGSNIYGALTLANQHGYGNQACYRFTMESRDREESSRAAAGSFSPGSAGTLCGEVFTLSFNGVASPLGAKVTNSNYNAVGRTGWGTLRTIGDARLPIVGFSAMSMLNQTTGEYYGWTTPHRWSN